MKDHIEEKQIDGRQTIISEAGKDWAQVNNPTIAELSKLVSRLRYPSLDSGYSINLLSGGSLTLLTSGDVSNVFIHEQKGERKIVKVKKDTEKANQFGQSYLDEIKQIGAIKKDLALELQELGFGIPNYLLAQEDLLIMDFVEGTTPTIVDFKIPGEYEFSNKATRLKILVDEYIERQRLTDRITWGDGIKADVINFPFVRCENFRKKDDLLWWVDPLFVDRK